MPSAKEMLRAQVRKNSNETPAELEQRKQDAKRRVVGELQSLDQSRADLSCFNGELAADARVRGLNWHKREMTSGDVADLFAREIDTLVATARRIKTLIALCEGSFPEYLTNQHEVGPLLDALACDLERRAPLLAEIRALDRRRRRGRPRNELRRCERILRDAGHSQGEIRKYLAPYRQQYNAIARE